MTRCKQNRILHSIDRMNERYASEGRKIYSRKDILNITDIIKRNDSNSETLARTTATKTVKAVWYANRAYCVVYSKEGCLCTVLEPSFLSKDNLIKFRAFETTKNINKFGVKTPCYCHSYNWDIGDVPTIQMLINGKTCCIDACIAPVIQLLNTNGFITIGSCCGHNKQTPSILFNSDFSIEDSEKARKLIKTIDNREFELQTWKLCTL